MPSQITVRGESRGRRVAVTWRPGELTGDPFAVADIRDAVAVGREVGEAGIAIGPATLELDDGPDLVASTLTSVFDHVASVEGIEPEEIPEGAEA